MCIVEAQLRYVESLNIACDTLLCDKTKQPEDDDRHDAIARCDFFWLGWGPLILCEARDRSESASATTRTRECSFMFSFRIEY
jgi:hypothetical protein